MNDTTQMKTAELTGAALDWAVAKCEGFVQADDPPWEAGHEPFAYSTDWALAGPIIEREHIRLQPTITAGGYRAPNTADAVMAMIELPNGATVYRPDAVVTEYGPTALIAAMRCYVASKIGDEVEIPAALLNGDRP